MEYCEQCQEETLFIDIRYSGAVMGEDGNHYDIYLHTCSECGHVDTEQSGVE